MATVFQISGVLKHEHTTKARLVARSVSFDPKTTVFLIPHVDEFTNDDRRMIWFEDYEYKQIKENNKILCKMMKSGKYEEDDQYCYRGLEFKTTEGARKRRIAKASAAIAVFSGPMKGSWDASAML